MKKIICQTFLIGAFLLGSVSTVLAAAATCQEYCADQKLGQPSGKACLCNPLASANFEDLVNTVIMFLIKISIPIATIMFVIAGIVFVTAAGDPAKFKKAKDIMVYTGVGLAVILVASGLIKVLQSLLGGK